VPQAGYKIKGLKIVGLQRSLTWKNVLFPFKLVASLRKAQVIIKEFNPDIVIGVGGYASAPTLAMAAFMSIPTLIQEQNSYAGLTNRWLSKKVDKICVAYDNMDKVFESAKIKVTGNPVRGDLMIVADPIDARTYFDLRTEGKVILIFGGSLGARTLNEAMARNVTRIKESGIQFIWQIGSYYKNQFIDSETAQLSNVRALEFIDRMDLAYQCADLVICRAGALTISELSVLAKASILVPSPNVSEDHQTFNAEALVTNEATCLVSDEEASKLLIDKALEIVHDEVQLVKLRQNIGAMGKPNATEEIVNEIEKLLSK
jgi:UDP-N-acetylglucosamine--N-acetylmuramyl-(pentapeptide) pyrophosphoryl-undecaprenol N-acetylglucosamine transferase